MKYTLEQQIEYMKHSIAGMEGDPEAPAEVLEMDKGILENLISLGMLMDRITQNLRSHESQDN